MYACLSAAAAAAAALPCPRPVGRSAGRPVESVPVAHSARRPLSLLGISLTMHICVHAARAQARLACKVPTQRMHCS